MISKNNRKAQVTIFVIIAIVLVAAIIIFFAARNYLPTGITSTEFSLIYESFDNCIEQRTLEALSIAGSQAGYIYPPGFVPGSEYAPFSNQLDFVGIGVPYWYYITPNGLVKEQVPSKRVIENQLEDFLSDEISKCDFSSFREQGFIVDSDGVNSVDVNINDKNVRVSVNIDIIAERGDSKEIKSTHEIEVDSKFGKFYELALEIYDKELKESFLENLSVDVMYNYAPVTGSEVSCSPLIWNPNEIVDDLKQGLSANVQALKINNNAFTLQNENNKYFVLDIKSDENVRFLYQEDWPTKIEIGPVENGVLIAEPIGLEEGLGILGFCYIPYHFIYDISYPVLIQIYNGDDVFQFPVAVIIDDSVPRNSLVSTTFFEEEGSLDDFCKFRNTNVDVFTFDNVLNPVEADISYTCLNERCNIGSTKISGGDAVLSSDFPQCINGFVEASAEGYVTARQIISTNEPQIANIVLDKIYELDLELVIGGLELEIRDNEGIAIVTFNSENYDTTIVYPSQKKVKLAEGLYEITVRVYSGSSLVIPGSSERQCVEVPNAGLLGFFGGTSEECFIVDIPSQSLDNALSSGGNVEEFILENELQSANKLKISVPLLPSPSTLEQVQANYQLVDVYSIGVSYS